MLLEYSCTFISYKVNCTLQLMFTFLSPPPPPPPCPIIGSRHRLFFAIVSSHLQSPSIDLTKFCLSCLSTVSSVFLFPLTGSTFHVQ